MADFTRRTDLPAMVCGASGKQITYDSMLTLSRQVAVFSALLLTSTSTVGSCPPGPWPGARGHGGHRPPQLSGGQPPLPPDVTSCCPVWPSTARLPRSGGHHPAHLSSLHCHRGGQGEQFQERQQNSLSPRCWPWPGPGWWSPWTPLYPWFLLPRRV